eukprot:g15456.t1
MRYNRHNYQLLIGLKFDGAPFNKRGNSKSQTVVLAHIANSHWPVTIETLMLCGIINADEESKHTQKMCMKLDERMAAFQKMVEERAFTENPYRVEGERINSVKIFLTMDMKAMNKVLGAGTHSSTFFGVTHAGLTTASTGIGNRHKSERKLFENYHRDPGDSTEIWKKGEKPIELTHDIRKQLRMRVVEKMANLGLEINLNRRNEKAWIKKASKFAKNEGHSFIYKEYFPKSRFEGVCYCPLHFKTVKVLDVLQLAMLAMTSYDRYRGRFEAVGPALNYFLDQLDQHEAFHSQLSSFASDARLMWVKLKVKKGLCHTGDGIRNLNSLLEKHDQTHTRLIGRQANVVLNGIETFESIMLKALTKGTRNEENIKLLGRSKKTQNALMDNMKVVVSSIMSYLLCIRNLVYFASRSGLETYKNNVDHDTYTQYVENVVKKTEEAAKMMDMIQSNLFPNLCRPYDISMTFCLPVVCKQLLKFNMLQGYEGLLEQSERYHSWLTKMPSYKTDKATTKRRRAGVDAEGNTVYTHVPHMESRNRYKFGRAWLVNAYFCMQPYGISESSRRKTAESRTDIIPNSKYSHFDGPNASCHCGAEGTSSSCEFCKDDNKTMKDYILTLAKKSVDLIGSDASRETRAIHTCWKDLRKRQFIIGLKVRYTFDDVSL